MKKDTRYIEKQLEWQRRSFNYKQFDFILSDCFGGDIEEMHMWVISIEVQFKTKFEHDQFLTDFKHWMQNRKISIHES
tara:strand:- start:219 stop:452 length:234 start_codon:yes stop_codon:yes gene_type:complete